LACQIRSLLQQANMPSSITAQQRLILGYFQVILTVLHPALTTAYRLLVSRLMDRMVAPSYYSGSTLNDLGIPSGFTSSFVFGINNNGQIAGGASCVQPITLRSISHAFLNDGSTWTDLGVPAGYLSSGGGAINSNGLIAGSATTSGSISHAFLYNGSTWTDLGTLYPSNLSSCSGAADINDNGQIVGNSSTSNAFPYADSHAFLYNDSGMIDLGVVSGADMSVAHAINNNGQIVGDLRLNGTGDHPYHAFLYDDSTMKDLNTLLDSSAAGWTITTANDINNNGQIVGWATNSSGYTHAVLLTPVPEPSIIALFITGTIGVLVHVGRPSKVGVY
jgi:probable HAF family extracellular repeat protein